MLSSRAVILAEAISRNLQQMLPLVNIHICICTSQYYQFYLVVLN